MMGLN